MKTALAACTLLLACALAGCNKPAPENASESAKPTPSAQQQAAPTQAAPAPAAPVTKAQILASGKTGLWTTDGATACHPRSRATLAWNVKDATHGKVVVWLDISGKGKERAVKSGGPVGTFTSGPWVQAGSVFVLREAGSRRELGRVTVGNTPC